MKLNHGRANCVLLPMIGFDSMVPGQHRADAYLRNAGYVRQGRTLLRKGPLRRAKGATPPDAVVSPTGSQNRSTGSGFRPVKDGQSVTNVCFRSIVDFVCQLYSSVDFRSSILASAATPLPYCPNCRCGSRRSLSSGCILILSRCAAPVLSQFSLDHVAATVALE